MRIYAMALLASAAVLGIGASHSANTQKADICWPLATLVDRHGHGKGCTHGNDAPDMAASQSLPQSFSASTTVPCIGDGTSGSRVQMLYVYDAAQINRLPELYPSFQMWAASMQDEVSQSAAATGGSRLIRFVTNQDCTLNVPAVPIAAADLADFASSITAVQQAGYGQPNRKYIMWADTNVYCGIGQLISGGASDIPTSDNASNVTTEYGRVDSGCWDATYLGHRPELHELMHTLGAVQYSAPHATILGHCTDEYDVMCYMDTYGTTLTYPCPDPASEGLLDCGGDDYFNTDPSPGSYLATHWDTANSAFLECVACDMMPPSVTIVSPTDGQHVGGQTPVRATAQDPSGISAMTLSLDGIVEASSATDAVSWAWRSGSAPKGAHVITASASDSHGNYATATVTVYR